MPIEGLNTEEERDASYEWTKGENGDWIRGEKIQSPTPSKRKTRSAPKQTVLEEPPKKTRCGLCDNMGVCKPVKIASLDGLNNICEKCIRQSKHCQKCEKMVLSNSDYIKMENETIFCRACFKEGGGALCSWCNMGVLAGNIITPSGTGLKLCHKCVADSCECDVCHQPSRRGNMIDFSGGRRCAACQERAGRSDSHINGRKDVPKTIFSETFASYPFQRRFGCEIEAVFPSDVEWGDVRDRTKCLVVSDGSIGEYGKEIVTPPLQGDKGLEFLKNTCDGLKELKAKADKRCGLHVHIDVGDFSEEDVKRTLILYYVLEPYLFSMMPNERRFTTYAQPLQETQMIQLETDGLDSFLYKGTVSRSDWNDPNKRASALQSRKLSKSGSTNRYFFVNSQAYYYLGTLEIRLHGGTVNYDEIWKWAYINTAIIEFAKKTSKDELSTLRWSKKSFLTLFPLEIQAYIVERWKKYGFSEETRRCAFDILGREKLEIAINQTFTLPVVGRRRRKCVSYKLSQD